MWVGNAVMSLSDLAIGLSPNDLRGHVPNTHTNKKVRIRQGEHEGFTAQRPVFMLCMCERKGCFAVCV
jgi:hypothetical protein